MRNLSGDTLPTVALSMQVLMPLVRKKLSCVIEVYIWKKKRSNPIWSLFDQIRIVNKTQHHHTWFVSISGKQTVSFPAARMDGKRVSLGVCLCLIVPRDTIY